MNSSSFAQGLAISGVMPRLTVDMADTVNIGFMAPLSGAVESWGAPGLNGCLIWQDWLNRAGGLLIGGRRYPIKIHAYDCEYDANKAAAGVRELVQDCSVQLLMMLGGETLRPVVQQLMDQKVLTTTLLTSDLSPDTRYLLAPSELHPLYTVTAVDWLAKSKPDLKSVALCAQKDLLGLPSLATYRAAFKAANIDVVKDIQYDPLETDIAAIADPMLAANPDILCWCTSYTPMVHALTEYAYAKGYKGQLLSCTLDQYDRLIERTSQEFMQDFLFQFPDFDDPMLREKDFFFNRPKAFFEEYNTRFPNSWTAVSWEYAAILDIWHAAVEKSGTTNSTSVLAAMKQLGQVTHAFGPAKWWGKDLFGIDNALVGDWPVVSIKGDKARIQAFGSIPAWLEEHSDLLNSEMQKLGQKWDQRLLNDPSTAGLGARNF
ncbi:MAG: branched-chain amino acid transport system substrate-binding protein [Paracoccaceae bacterium]|jgi:branched-chain amino acid transport system substrate-binding protein